MQIYAVVIVVIYLSIVVVELHGLDNVSAATYFLSCCGYAHFQILTFLHDSSSRSLAQRFWPRLEVISGFSSRGITGTGFENPTVSLRER